MDRNDLVVDDLNNADVFKELNDEEYAEFLHTGRAKKVKDRTVLFHQGDPAQRCYWVRQGRLKLSRVNEEGKEVTLRYIFQGEIAAAVAVIKNSEYSVTALAMEDTEVVAWEKFDFIKLMERFPRIPVNILTIVLNRLDDIQNRYTELCTEQVEQRIARTLLRFIRTCGARRHDGIYIETPLSRQDLAEYIGTTVFTVSRTLSKWERKGWIKSDQKKIIVTDPHALVSFTE